MIKEENLKFDVVIGNPPYQKKELGGNLNYMPSIYPNFIDKSFNIGHIAELITPAKFLFGAGKYQKGWINKILNNDHLKVVYFNQKSKEVFSEVDIKGGVAVSYFDDSLNFGKIGTFIPYKELDNIVKKVQSKTDGDLSKEVVSSCTRLSDIAIKLNPDILDLINGVLTLRPNSFEKFYGKIFFNEPQTSDSVKILGRFHNKRVWLWVDRKLIKTPDNFSTYNVLITSVSGNGFYGERLAPTIISPPDTGYTNSFRAIGNFEEKEEAEALTKYLKTRFLRSLIGVLKSTHQFPPKVFKYVPLQDFTNASDIDWSKSIHDIDSQLYEKYHLNDDEIGFIESHVKEMS